MSNGPDISNCPARQDYLPNDTSGCHCYYVNKGIIDVSAATPYNTTYYKESNWNWNTTNTKMYRPIGLIVPNRVPQCPATSGCYPNPITTTGVRQSGNMFPNTHKMSQKKLFSYLSRNRIYLNR